MVCILFGEISIFHSRVMGLYSSNCRRFFICHAVNWEPLGQFTSNFAQLLELIVLWSVYFWWNLDFSWERKSLQILYECWRWAYHALLAHDTPIVNIHGAAVYYACIQNQIIHKHVHMDYNPLKRMFTYFIIKIVNCTLCIWSRKSRSLEDSICQYIDVELLPKFHCSLDS
jgi:hypothetical protein